MDIRDGWSLSLQLKRWAPAWRLYLRIGGMLLLIIGLLGPYFRESAAEVRIRSREIYILLDVSASMNVRDLRPSRLGKARRELKKLAEALKGDKFGLIVFGSEAYVQCPLTVDQDALSLMLDLADSKQFANTGTEFRNPLLLALDRIERSRENALEASRIIVLVSDGEDFGDTFSSVLDRLRRSGVHVFTVGVGTHSGGPVPDISAAASASIRNPDGTRVISTLSEGPLKEIATFCGTTYVPLDAQGRSLDALADQIRWVSAMPQNSEVSAVQFNRYQFFLLAGFLSIFGAMFWLPIQRK
jgi:Ca-activated chloride channel family protein